MRLLEPSESGPGRTGKVRPGWFSARQTSYIVQRVRTTVLVPAYYSVSDAL